VLLGAATVVVGMLDAAVVRLLALERLAHACLQVLVVITVVGHPTSVTRETPDGQRFPVDPSDQHQALDIRRTAAQREEMTTQRRRPSPAVQAFNRVARPLAGTPLMPVWAQVHHVGRRSGASYTTTVAVFPAAGTFYIALPWGRETDWVRNLRAAGGGRMVWRGRTYDVSDPTFVDKTEVLGVARLPQREILKRWDLEDFLRVRRVEASR
jgi:deazaflavin-dependent oxidoreductase (nitroreductase family)